MLHFFPFSTLPTSPTTTILNRIFLNCLEVATKWRKKEDHKANPSDS